MDKKLQFKDYVFIGSLLFGLFFGAGNLIFPIQMGQLAGSDMWLATAGFIITAVGLPFLGIVAMGLARKESMYELASKISPGYGMFYTVALYLTIGPFFAIPRTATVSFEAAFAPYLNQGMLQIALVIFSTLFFGFSLWFTLRPSGILTWIGKVLNPIFLASLTGLVIFTILKPMGEVAQIPVQPLYQEGSFFRGFLEGYNTMDALAALAFGIIVISTIKSLGVTKPSAIAKDTIIAGLFSTTLMAVIYASLVYVGASSQGIFGLSANGGVALAVVSNHYFGSLGAVVLAVIIIVACFKTAVGLLTAISEMFVTLFPNKLTYNQFVYLFTGISFGIANLGLAQIITLSVPVLMFLYPLAITLIFTAILSPLFKDKAIVYQVTTLFTLPFAVLDFIHALPKESEATANLTFISEWAEKTIPLFAYGMSWVIPALIGFVIGFVLSKLKK